MTDRKEYKKQYYIKNKVRLTDLMRKWKQDNPQYWKKYSKENKELLDKISKRYREKNKGKIKLRNKKYYGQNKDKRKEYLEKNKDEIKEYRKKNKDRMANYSKEYFKTHKHIYSNRCHKRRTRMKFTDIDSKWLKQLYEDTNICEVCNRKMKDKSIDHILPLNVGGLHIKSNVRIICLKCNQQRPKNGSDIIQFRLL